MRKNIKFSLVGLGLLAIFIAGCDTASQEVADVISPDGYPVATFTSDATGSDFSEGDTITYTIVVNKQLTSAIQFTARVIGGTASNADFENVGGVLQPYSDTAILQVVIVVDDTPDPDETATLEIGSFNEGSRYLLNPSTVNPEITINIANYEEGILQMWFTWDMDIEVNPNYPGVPDYMDTYSAGSEMDFDIFISDGAGYDNADPWGTWLDFDYAATGNEPEEMAWMDTLANGVYVLFCELWYNTFADSLFIYEGYGNTVPDVQVPITAHFLQAGLQSAEIVQHESQVFTTMSQGADNPEWDGETAVDTYVCEVEISDGTFTIRDYAGSTVLKGATAGTRLQISGRPSSINK